MRNSTTSAYIEEKKKYIWKYHLLQYTNNSNPKIFGQLIVEVNHDMSSELIYPTQYTHDLKQHIYENPISIYSPFSVNGELHHDSVDLFLVALI